MKHTYTFDMPSFLFKNNRAPEGYIALMATIIIGAVLLVMSVGISKAGWYARFTILGTEAKEQSAALADGCANQALALLITDSTYVGDATTTLSIGSCYVFPIEVNAPLPGVITLRVQGIVRDSYTNLEMEIALNDVRLDSVPMPEPVVMPLLPRNFNVHLNSRKELPSLP
jgi:hypothetical protein